MKENTCCFFGHREMKETEEMRLKLAVLIENLIVNENVDTFLFGSKSRFNSLCLELVTELKEKYPHIKRIYVRAEYPDINEKYFALLHGLYASGMQIDDFDIDVMVLGNISREEMNRPATL